MKFNWKRGELSESSLILFVSFEGANQLLLWGLFVATQQVTGRSKRAFSPQLLCLPGLINFQPLLLSLLWWQNASQDQHLCLYEAHSRTHLKDHRLHFPYFSSLVEKSQFLHTQNHSYHLWKGYLERERDRFKVNSVNSTLLWGQHELCCFKTWSFSSMNSTLNQNTSFIGLYVMRRWQW